MRPRTHSAGSSSKRKKSTDSEQPSPEPFRNSKKTARSPGQIAESEKKMLTEMEEMMKTIMQDIKEIKEENTKFKDFIRTMQDQWMNESKKLELRIEQLESKLENQEKIQKRNNVIIKGIVIEDENLKEGIKNFFNTKLNVDVEIANCFELRKGKGNIIFVQLNNFEEKSKVMKNKAKLKGSNVYIENDLTEKQKTAQKALLLAAKEERAKGNSVKLGFQKIMILNKWYTWSHKENKLTLLKNGKNSNTLV